MSSNTRILYYDQVWKGNANVALALTTADVGKHNTSSNTLTIINIQNTSNNTLDFNPFQIGETVYAGDTDVTFEFLNREFIIYLDTAPGGNGYGFIPGSTVTQYCPRVTKDITLTVDEYLSICGCSSCGCKKDECGCVEGPSTAQDRTITVIMSEAKTVNAIVDYESTNPPYVAVYNADGILCDQNITSGGITANIVGALTPPLERDPFLGNYIIQRPGVYSEYTLDDCGNFVSIDDLSQYLGPHIGIDRHFTGRRSQDYNNDNIIVSNWDITGQNIPIGKVKDYWNNADHSYVSIGMSVNANSYSTSSKLFKLSSKTKGDVKAEIDAKGALFLRANSVDSTFEINNKCNDILTVANNVSVNTTMYTRSYAENHKTLSSATLTLNVAQSSIFTVPSSTTITSINFVKPITKGDAAYSCSIVVPSSSTISAEAWNNVLWPYGQAPIGQATDDRVLSFLNIHESSNIARQQVWYGFGNISTGAGGGGPGPFLWYKPTRAHDLKLIWSWDVPDPYYLWNPEIRVWFESPETRLWTGEDRSIGWANNGILIDRLTVAFGGTSNPYSNGIFSLYSIYSQPPYQLPWASETGREWLEIPIDIMAEAGGDNPYYNDNGPQVITVVPASNVFLGYSNTSYSAGNTYSGSATTISNSILGTSGLTYDSSWVSIDDSSKAYSLPFPIMFRGITHNFIFVGSNGFLTFGQGFDGTNPVNIDVIRLIPGDRRIIGVYYGTSGVAPNRTFRMRLEYAASYTQTTTNSVIEVTFYENTSGNEMLFDVQYDMNLASGSPSVGIYSVTNTALATWSDTPYTGYNVSVNLVPIEKYLTIDIINDVKGTTGLTLDTSFQNVDDDFKELSLPFDFNFGGTVYNSIFVGTNGYLTFGSGSALQNPSLEIIKLYAGDRILANLYYGTEGIAPDRTFRIRMENAALPTTGLYDAVSIPNSILGAFGLTLNSDLENVDDSYTEIPFAFDIKFAGTTYTSVFVSTNGYLTFGSGSSDYTVSNTTPAKEKIFLFGGDRRGRAIYYGVSGTAPNRTFRMRIGASRDLSDSAANLFAEVIFFENDTGDNNTFEVHYDNNISAAGIVGAYSSTGAAYAVWSNEPNTSYRIDGLPSGAVLVGCISEVTLYEGNTSKPNNFKIDYGINGAANYVSGANSASNINYASWSGTPYTSYLIYYGNNYNQSSQLWSNTPVTYVSSQSKYFDINVAAKWYPPAPQTPNPEDLKIYLTLSNNVTGSRIVSTAMNVPATGGSERPTYKIATYRVFYRYLTMFKIL